MRRVLPYTLAVLVMVSVAVLADSIHSVQPDPTVLDQTTKLTALGRVWGLLKYFHPDVARGPIDWDAELVRTIPRINAAQTKAELNDGLMRLIAAPGPLPRLAAGVRIDRLEEDPAFAWLDDPRLFSATTIETLKIVRNSDPPPSNRYVKPATVPNPDFSGETAYESPAFPSLEMRLLALFRFWNMVQYYAPNRDITDMPWRDVLPHFIPKFMEASDATSYHLTVAELTASINDTHAATSSPTLNAYWGIYGAPLQTRFIESQTVVTRVLTRLSNGADVQPGDVVTHVNGVSTAELRERVRGYIPASNEGSLQRNIDFLLMRARTPAITIQTRRDGVERTITLTAPSLASIYSEMAALDAQQPKWRMLDGNIGYVNMGLLEVADVPSMMNEFRNTRGIVFDVRNYPKGTGAAIAERINDAPREFVKFTKPRYDRPGTFDWQTGFIAGPRAPTSNHYRGRVILLGDDRSQSHAEFTMMTLRTAPDVTVVGTPTAGADGNVSLITLPGGVRTYFSGLGVFYPDGSPTQRVGIVPDVVVAPTIAGIRNGVDEVLARAVALVGAR